MFEPSHVGDDDVLPVRRADLLQRPHERAECTGGRWNVEDEEAAELELREQLARDVGDAATASLAQAEKCQLCRRPRQRTDDAAAVRVLRFCGFVSASVEATRLAGDRGVVREDEVAGFAVVLDERAGRLDREPLVDRTGLEPDGERRRFRCR